MPYNTLKYTVYAIYILKQMKMEVLPLEVLAHYAESFRSPKVHNH